MQEFLPLSAAEEKLVEICHSGNFAEFGSERPSRATSDNRIRAELLRLLAMNGDDKARVHEKGLQIEGAYIVGALDLEGCVVDTPLYLFRCWFSEEINAMGARLRGLYLVGSRVPGLMADRMECRGGLFLRSGFLAEGLIRLVGAEILGNVSCRGGKFQPGSGAAIEADRVKISGSLLMSNDFEATGEVRLVGATIGASLDIENARFHSTAEHALSLDSITVKGRARIRSCSFHGSVRLPNARITSYLLIAEPIFAEEVPVNFRLDNLTAGGALALAKLEGITGEIDLTGASSSSLADDDSRSGYNANLRLDGYRYGRFVRDAAGHLRSDWLKRSKEGAQAEAFRSQPWEQAVRVLREMGHLEDAKIVAIEKQRHMRHLGLIGNRQPRQSSQPWRTAEKLWLVLVNLAAVFFHATYGALAGYGFRPLRTVAFMVAAWLFAAGIYNWAEARGLFAPTAPAVIATGRFADCAKAGVRWTRCDLLPVEYTAFDPLMYSLDVILPLVDLKQESDWGPVVARREGWSPPDQLLTRAVMWIEILFGWITSLLLVSALGRLVQKD